MFEVFISHSSKDKLTADAVCAILEQCQIRCWIAPRDIVPGVEWGEAILTGIGQCRVMVIVFSTSANQSAQVRREVERAVSKGAIIVPLRIEDILPVKSMEYFLSNVHWLDAFTPPLTAHIDRLAGMVLGLLGREDEPVTPTNIAKPSLPLSERVAAKTKDRPLSTWQRLLRLPRREMLIGAAVLVLLCGVAWWRTHPTVKAVGNPVTVNKDKPWTNSLGMKFVPVSVPPPSTDESRELERRAIRSGMPFVPEPDNEVLFCIWETRVQDYELFAKDTKRKWKKPEFEQGPTHPAVNVSWEDATAFCDWLSKKEGRMYRLPTDAEWSAAKGLRNEGWVIPKEKAENGASSLWAIEWPPPKGAGNFADASAKKADSAHDYIDGYDDGFAYTSPVGKFTANTFGLYDLSGNVWEWCQDAYEWESTSRVIRGGSWSEGNRDIFASSYRGNFEPGETDDDVGFRCVLEKRPLP